MNTRSTVHAWLSIAALAAACGSNASSEAPAHLVLPAPLTDKQADKQAEPAPSAAKSVAVTPAAAPASASPVVARPAPSSAHAVKAAPEKVPAVAALPVVAASAAASPQSVVTTPAPNTPAPKLVAAAPPAASTKVIVPHTEHMHVEVPPGLQHWLDEDDRMVPWLGEVVGVIDGCYARARADNAAAEGTIVLGLEMHENARPDAEVKILPPALSAVVACATGGLMRTHMPLFTGREGERYQVKVRFSR